MSLRSELILEPFGPIVSLTAPVLSDSLILILPPLLGFICRLVSFRRRSLICLVRAVVRTLSWRGGLQGFWELDGTADRNRIGVLVLSAGFRIVGRADVSKGNANFASPAFSG